MTSAGKHHHLTLRQLHPPRLSKDGLAFELSVSEFHLPAALIRHSYVLRCGSRSEANRWVAACAAMQLPGGRRSMRGNMRGMGMEMGGNDMIGGGRQVRTQMRPRSPSLQGLIQPTDIEDGKEEGGADSPVDSALWRLRRKGVAIGDLLIVQLAVSLSVHELSVVLPVEMSDGDDGDSDHFADANAHANGSGSGGDGFGWSGGGGDGPTKFPHGQLRPPHVLHLQLLGLGAHLRMRPLDMDLSAHLLALLADCGDAPPPADRPNAPPRTIPLLSGGRRSLIAATGRDASMPTPPGRRQRRRTGTSADDDGSSSAAASASDDALLMVHLALSQPGSPAFADAAAATCVEAVVRPLQVHCDVTGLTRLMAHLESFVQLLEPVTLMLNHIGIFLLLMMQVREGAPNPAGRPPWCLIRQPVGFQIRPTLPARPTRFLRLPTCPGVTPPSTPPSRA